MKGAVRVTIEEEIYYREVAKVQIEILRNAGRVEEDWWVLGLQDLWVETIATLIMCWKRNMIMSAMHEYVILEMLGLVAKAVGSKEVEQEVVGWRRWIMGHVPGAGRR